MASARLIFKSLSTSERYWALNDVAGKLAEFCQALYPLLVVHADDFGRLQGDPKTVKLGVIPGSPRKLPEVQAALRNLHEVGLITIYSHPEGPNGRIYLQVNDFEEHQRGLHKRTKSRFPEPPANSGKVRKFPSDLDLDLDQKRKGIEEGIVPEIDPTDTWCRIVEALDISDHSKNMWFRPCWLLRETDELLEIAAPTKTLAEFLRTTNTVKNAMAAVCPGKGLSIVVQTNPKANPKSKAS